jgi:hypothetical protein
MGVRQKSELPTKVFACCERPFAWRKKWERDWAGVRYCSDRCRQSGAKGDHKDDHKDGTQAGALANPAGHADGTTRRAKP